MVLSSKHSQRQRLSEGIHNEIQDDTIKCDTIKCEQGSKHSRAWFGTSLVAREGKNKPKCFCLLWSPERKNMTQGRKYLTVLSFCSAWKLSANIFDEVCEIYKPNINNFRHKLCRCHSHLLPVHMRVCYFQSHLLPFLGSLRTSVAWILWPCADSLCSAHLFHHVPDRGDLNHLPLWIKQLLSLLL